MLVITSYSIHYTKLYELADAAALYAVELISTHLKSAVFDGRNMEARAGMPVPSARRRRRNARSGNAVQAPRRSANSYNFV